MKILMGTHIFLWAIADPDKLSDGWRLAIESQANQIYLSAISVADALLLKNMPFHHRDPFDRMLIAQGLQNSIGIMINDAKFHLYDCRLID